MTIQYRLYPPFLFIPESPSFSDSWENFCCKLLNVQHGTSDIYVRNPPEQGVDLYSPSRKTAYQCKSVESGKSGDFNYTHAVNSYNSALGVKSTLPWDEYVLCTNVALTGTAISNLQKGIPNLKILPASHWVALCEKNSDISARYFRVVVDVQPKNIGYNTGSLDVSSVFGDDHSSVDSDAYYINLYSNRNDSLYRLPVRLNLTVRELISSLRSLFKLPDDIKIESEGIGLSLSHSIAVDGKKIPLNLTLSQAGITSGMVVTYWTTINIRELGQGREFRSDVIQMITSAGEHSSRERKHVLDAALRSYKAQLANRFSDLDRFLLDHNSADAAMPPNE